MSSAANRTVPPDYESWWSRPISPWWRDIDYLGHVTAASYASIYEEVFGDFMVEAWQDPEPWYVVADLSISYLREIRMADVPLTVYVKVDEHGGSTIAATMVIAGTDSEPRSVARTRYVAWDREQRRKRPMTTTQLDGLARLSRR
jgi:acyl-CoA thioesterase FadM